jgi:poly(A) polymerase
LEPNPNGRRDWKKWLKSNNSPGDANINFILLYSKLENLNFNTIITQGRDEIIFRSVAQISRSIGFPVYVVGGYVRDIILSRPSKDIDFVVLGDGVAFATEFAKILPGKPRLSVFKTFGTANVRFRDYEIEFVGARKESYQRNSRNPVVEPGTLVDDLNRRDFTINALAISLNNEDYGQLIDLFNGITDIDNGLIKTPLEPGQTFSDDPLRMMRAIRFAAQLSFDLESVTYNSIRENKERINIISKERITDELNKILLSSQPSKGFKLLFTTGLLKLILPEVEDLIGTETVDNKSHKDNFYHTLQVLDNVADNSDNLWLRWTALLHDIGKPVTKKFDPQSGWTFYTHEIAGARMIPDIFKRLKMPLGENLRYIRKLVSLHLRPVSLTKEEVTDSAVRRLIVEAGDYIDDLMLLCKADVTSKNLERASTFIRRFDMVEEKIKLVEEKDKLRNWKNPITGELIMEVFGIKPGKEIGLIKESVKEAIMDGLIQNEYEDAYQFMLKIGKEKGLNPVR